MQALVKISLRQNLPNGYIAGTGNGIVTVNGQLASRAISVFYFKDGKIEPTIVTRVWSLPNGHYLITNLDPSKRYLIMCRALKDEAIGGVNSTIWDHVTPASDLTIAEQYELWQSWQ